MMDYYEVIDQLRIGLRELFTIEHISLFLTILFIALVIIGIWFINECEKTRIKYDHAVKCYSKRYRDLLDLNRQYAFFDCNMVSWKATLQSKAQFDRLNLRNFFEKKVESNRLDILYYKWQIEQNNTIYAKYLYDLSGIHDCLTEREVRELGFKWDRFNELETALTMQAIQHPTLRCEFVCYKYYTSPGGRKCYSDKLYFSDDDLDMALTKISEEEKKKDTTSYQRKAMTNSLRYKIMKRDSFRCVLCGRTARDGIKLHVDHIKPVSKGGKTIESNLRTLCDACNLGKSDLYDETGLN